ncbi:MAG: hypothetical protein IJD21_03765 [Oscillospiraceae bacterium]|nr:hypothetical protein [Oscillospiraceae bacterium]
MKKWMLLLTLTLCLLLTGCSAGQEESVELDQTLAAAAEGEILWEEYAWGTARSVIEAEEITSSMEEGEDYVFYDKGGRYAGELIVNGQWQEEECQYYYCFNEKDQLVSVMILLNAGDSDEEMIECFEQQVSELRAQWGEPSAVGNEFDSGAYTELEDFIDAVKSEGSFSLWMDEAGNQVLISAYKEKADIEVLIRYTAAGQDD